MLDHATSENANGSKLGIDAKKLKLKGLKVRKIIAQGKRRETSAALGYYLSGFQLFAISQPQRGCGLSFLGLCGAVWRTIEQCCYSRR